MENLTQNPVTAGIWCRVIDNFGDAGVAWRLARSLKREYGWCVTLIIDKPETLAAFVPEVDAAGDACTALGIRVMRWNAAAERFFSKATTLPDVTVEAFSCRLPDGVEEALSHRFDMKPTAVFALDYLTAETYAEESNGLVSRHPRFGYPKTFVFPGFTEKTGGIVREADISEARKAFEAAGGKTAFLESSGADPAAPFTLFFFTYPTKAVDALAGAFASDKRPLQILLAPGAASEKLAAALAAAGNPAHVTTVRLPLLPQCEFDKPLLACDCALVRGEDSTVRVQLAGTPLLWMLYPQTEDTHLVKLAAFTKLYTRGMAEDDARIWSVLEAGLNGRILTPAAWSAYRDRFPAMQKAAQAWRTYLSCLTTAPEYIAQKALKQIKC